MRLLQYTLVIYWFIIGVALAQGLAFRSKNENNSISQSVQNMLYQHNQQIRFTENKGQIRTPDYLPRPDVKFVIALENISVIFRNTGVSYQFFKQLPSTAVSPDLYQHPIPGPTEIYRLDLEFLGSNPYPIIETGKAYDDLDNFYNVQPEVLGVRSFENIIYKDIYPNIDLKYYKGKKGLKYDFIVRPGGDPKQIRIKAAGATNVQQFQNGAIKFATPLGDILDDKPVSVTANGTSVKSNYVLENNELRFEISDYDKTQTLIIDPSIMWSTYYGGTTYGGGGAIYGVKIDNAGNVVATAGYCSLISGIATAGAHQTTLAGGFADNYIVKFSPSGVRLWGTYYGGNGPERGGFAITTDPSDNIIMVGSTLSTNGIADGSVGNATLTTPVSPAVGWDAFAVKFNSSGIRLWGQYIGGRRDDDAYDVGTDAAGNIYICGLVTAYISGSGYMGGSVIPDMGFPVTAGAHQTTNNGSPDGWLLKMDAGGNWLWSTYYGGDSRDMLYKLDVSPAGDIVVAGETNSTNNIATAGAHQTTHSNPIVSANYGREIFLAKFNTNGVRQWATYYGGNEEDWRPYCAFDNLGNIYLSGTTTSANNIATAGAHQSTITPHFATGVPARDNFIAKFNSAGNRLWATYYGGSGDEINGGLDVDDNNNVYQGGGSSSDAGIATVGSYFPTGVLGFYRAYMVKFNGAGVRQWGSYLTNQYGFQIFDLSVRGLCEYAVSGPINYGTPNAHQPTSTGGDGAIMKLGPPILVGPIVTPLCPGQAVSVPFVIETVCPLNAGNIFTAQLSDASGSFNSPVNIGTLAGTTSGTINATIPLGTTPGTGYRIRVITSNVFMYGADNGVNITISAPASSAIGPINGPAAACIGGSNTYSIAAVPGAISYVWSVPAGFTITSGAGTNSIQVSVVSGSGNISVTVTTNCGVSNATLPVSSTTSCDPSCPGCPATGACCNAFGFTEIRNMAQPAFTGVHNHTTCTNGYTNWTNQVQVCAGQQIRITFADFSNAGYYSYMYDYHSPFVYINWNRDGDFSDPGETYTLPVAYYFPIVDSAELLVTIPVSMTTGPLRIRMYVSYCEQDPWDPGYCVDVCNEWQDYTIYVNNGVPATPTDIIMPSCLNPSTPGYTFSTPIITGASTYTWTVPAGWTITSGQGTNTITVTTGAFPGNVSVRTGNVCGNSPYYSEYANLLTPGIWIWTGTVSTDWFNPANWNYGCSGSIPDCSKDVRIWDIPGVVYWPVIDAANGIGAACKSFDLGDGATFGFNFAEQLEVCQDFYLNDGSTFNSNFGTVKFSGTSYQHFAQMDYHRMPNVVINNNAASVGQTVYLYADMIIKPNCRLEFLQGIIDTESEGVGVTIEGTDSAAVIGYGPDKYIYGTLRRAVVNSTSYFFPVGWEPVALGNPLGYQLCNVTFTGGALGTGFNRLIVRFTPAVLSLGAHTELSYNYNCGLSSHGWWSVNPNTGATIDPSMQYTMTIWPRNFAPSCAGYNQWTVIKKPTGSPSGWALSGTAGSGYTGILAMAGTAIPRTGLTSFSDHAAIGASTPLPVSGIMLAGKWVGNDAKLSWKIQGDESRLQYYQLERLASNEDMFMPINRVVPMASSIYEYTDNSASRLAQPLRYRVIATDYDGAVKGSNIVELHSAGESNELTVYPNPTTGLIEIVSSGELPQQVRIFDAKGSCIFNQHFIGAQTQLDITGFAAGAYQLVCDYTDGSMKTIRLIKE